MTVLEIKAPDDENSVRAFGEGGYMVRMNPQEALRLIESLSRQLLTKDPNGGRAEYTTKDGKYFSVAVHDG